MAALLISSFFPTNGVADCYSGNHQGKKHHELREHLKVTHDRLCRFRLLPPNATGDCVFMLSLLCNSTCPAINWNRSGLSYMRMCLLGRRKAKRHLLPFKPWSLFTGSVIIISCQTIPVKPSEQLFNMFGSGAGVAAIRFYWGVLCSFTPAVCRSAPNRTACVSIPRGSESPFVRSHDVVRLSDFVGSLWDSTFLSGDPDGVRPESLIRKGTPFCVGVPFAIDL